ncbi:MAG: DNA-directed RNA polymerase subunit delta [Streptococcaceae bacterium]|jgi:DNA-directed RNA polymerase subunit delta|nr:DNA-directed RNA polymerase subunit delta [Streptococcaceae bacterium]
MKIKALDGQITEELSMIEVAHAILEQKDKEMTFTALLNEVKSYLKMSDDDIKAVIARFYTDLNTDGSFIPLGDNKWGLRSWYAIDSVDEETISLDYFEDDAVDDSVDPTLLEGEEDTTDENFKVKVVEEIVYDENADDEHDDTVSYDEELAEVDVDAEIPEGEVIEEADDDDEDDEDAD